MTTSMPPTGRRQRGTVVQSIAAGAIAITLLTIAVRILGLVRWGSQAAQVGSVGVAEAYSAANLIPNVLFEVVAGGALAGAIVPLLAGPIVARQAAKINLTVSALLTWTVTILSGVGLLTAFLAPTIINVIPRVNEPELADIATFFLRVFAVQLPLYGISVVLSGVLQAHRRFIWPAIAPAFSSVVVIVTYLVFGHLAHGTQTSPAAIPSEAVQLLAWGTTAGVAVMSLPLLIPVLRLRVSLRPTFRMPSGQARSFAALASAGVAGLLAQQLCIIMTMIAINQLAEPGGYPVWQYSQAVAMLIFGVLVVPIATSAFPVLSQHHSRGDTASLRAVASNVWRVITVVTIAGTATVICVARPIEAFFGFTHGGVTHMAHAVTWLAISLLAMAPSFYLARLLYATHHARAGAVGTVVGWCGAAGLIAVYMLTADGADTVGTFVGIGVASLVGLSVGLVFLVVATARVLGWRMVTAAGPGALRTAIVSIGAIVLSHVFVPNADQLGVGAGIVWVIAVAVPVFAMTCGAGLWSERASMRELITPTRTLQGDQ